MTVEEALAYLKPDAASNGTISLRAPMVREAVAVIEAEIAANQSRAFEDGARWMRQGAARVCWVQAAKDDLHALGLEAGGAIATACVVRNEAALHRARGNEIAALPLQPEGERSDA